MIAARRRESTVRIDWLPRAQGDLADIVDFVAADNPAAAYALHAAIIDQVAGLAEYPSSGRKGRVPGTRELVIHGTPYIAAYRAAGDTITILRVIHGARRWPRNME